MEDNDYKLTPSQLEIEESLTYWKLQQCENRGNGYWEVTWLYAFDNNVETLKIMTFDADSYEDAEHKAYIYTINVLE